MARSDTDWQAFSQTLAIRTALGVALRLPYRSRVPFMGALTARVVAPLAGWTERIRDNLHLVWEDLPEAEIRRMLRAVPDNAGRTLIENFSTPELLARAETTPLGGPGLEALHEARASGRPVIIATGHYGNYEASRAALTARGFQVGGLYRPMANPYFNRYYKRTLEAFGGPVFPQTRKGITDYVRALRAGGIMGLLFDLYVQDAPHIPFLGRPARTATSAADMAVKLDALLIPTFATRQPDGLSFNVALEEPIAHRDPLDMTAELNARLEARVRAHPDQWFWIHRRWKEL